MTLWQWFLVVGAGVVLFVQILDALIKLYKYLKHGKKNADAYFENRVKEIVKFQHDETRNRDSAVRELELKVLREFIASELRPIKDDIADIKMINGKLHHAQMTSLQIKLYHLFQDKFDIKGVLTREEQANWDKWFSDYTALGGNSDIKRMDELIQNARMQATLDKVRGKKRSTKQVESEEEKPNES